MRYNLNINLIRKPSTENHPIEIEIETEHIEDYCSKICTQGFMINDTYGNRFIPPHRIEDIEVDVVD